MRGRTAGGVGAVLGLAIALAGGLFGGPGAEALSVSFAGNDGGTGGMVQTSVLAPEGSSWTEFPLSTKVEVAVEPLPRSGTVDTPLPPGSSPN
ncbi:hypothetical protein [Cryptosporangium phraense]|uniref:Uncharacterized protein n=1 Tax=Cryptosporangium phraense TaxID=2593070 RepID=A0A545AYB8_9ACTN|nr:hypothetical protein [Cryptosporangium phraense]TQS46318.1 hypothetical protein FL583_02680 [Cryptosporangium phraense]